MNAYNVVDNMICNYRTIESLTKEEILLLEGYSKTSDTAFRGILEVLKGWDSELVDACGFEKWDKFHKYIYKYYKDFEIKEVDEYLAKYD